MEEKIETTIAYYEKKGQEILRKANSKNNMTADELIHLGEEMAIIEYKLTALEVIKEN